MIAADTAMLLPDDFLVKVDRASMAHGLEARPPLLDHELLELAARIPSEYKIREKKTKWIFKEAFRTQLPPGLLERKNRDSRSPSMTGCVGRCVTCFRHRAAGGRSGRRPDRPVARKPPLQPARFGREPHGWGALEPAGSGPVERSLPSLF